MYKIKRKEILERDKEALDREREERAKARQHEKLLAEREREERMRASEHKMLIAAKNIKLEQAKGAASSANNSSRSRSQIFSSEPASSSVKARARRLPGFDKKKDEIDAYLRRFERFTEKAGWKSDDWGINISALLTGKALEVYSRLTSAEADEYDTVKDSLLKRYLLTEEGFRQKFRESKPEQGDTLSQFVSRLQSYLGRWMKLSNVADIYEGIKDLFLGEQFLGVCNKNLALLLKERTPNSVDKMTNLADKYLEARGGTICFDPVTVKPKTNTISTPPKPRPEVPNQT